MTDPFRDNQHDPGTAMRFSQHIGIAEGVLEEIEQIPQHIHNLKDGDGLTQEVIDIWTMRWATGWQNVWEQLKEARAIVAKKRRDVSAFDEALAAAGDLYVGVASGKAVNMGSEVHVTWRNVSTSTAKDAIAALRAAMPEVVVVKQAPLEVDLEPTSSKVLWIGCGVAVLAVLVYIVYRAIS